MSSNSAAVHFMAETAKIVNPSRLVCCRIFRGCQLADSAPAEDLRARIAELKKQYPDLAVVSYVNTTAAVKGLSDIIWHLRERAESRAVAA